MPPGLRPPSLRSGQPFLAACLCVRQPGHRTTGERIWRTRPAGAAWKRASPCKSSSSGHPSLHLRTRTHTTRCRPKTLGILYRDGYREEQQPAKLPVVWPSGRQSLRWRAARASRRGGAQLLLCQLHAARLPVRHLPGAPRYAAQCGSTRLSACWTNRRTAKSPLMLDQSPGLAPRAGVAGGVASICMGVLRRR